MDDLIEIGDSKIRLELDLSDRATVPPRRLAADPHPMPKSLEIHEATDEEPPAPSIGEESDLVRPILTAPVESPRTVHLSIPPWLEGVVPRMLAKRPEDRFPDAGSLHAEPLRIGRDQGLTP